MKSLNKSKHRAEKILNAINLFKVINEHATSVIIYHISVLKIKTKDYKKLYNDIRKILTNIIYIFNQVTKKNYMYQEKS